MSETKACRCGGENKVIFACSGASDEETSEEELRRAHDLVMTKMKETAC